MTLMRKHRFLSKTVLLATACGVLGACSVFEEKKPAPLEGERISVMQLQKDLVVEVSQEALADVEIPEVWNNQFWPQAGGYPNHAMQNLGLSDDGSLERVWRAKIGQGSSDEIPLNAQPIVVDGKVYTLDTAARVRAFAAEDGDLLWSVNTHKEDDEDVIPGGLAFFDNLLFVTNGYNEIVALDPETGKEVWGKTLPTPVRAAPSVLDGRVYVVTLDSKLYVLDVRDGSFLWDYQGIAESSGLVGAASPALDSEIVVAAFSSGEVAALRVANGAGVWSDNLANVRGVGGLSGIADIRAFPVIDKDMVFAVSFAGKMVALAQATGTRIWSRDISSTETPWVAGNYVYVLTSDNQLVALMRETGAIRWVTDLPRDEDGDLVRYNGPVMVNGQLMVVRSDGLVVELDAVQGAVQKQWPTKYPILTSPVVAGNTLYLLAETGILLAYR